MDDIDLAQQRAALILNKQIEAARQGGGHMAGPEVCRCGEVNDRAAEGFAICSACAALNI